MGLFATATTERPLMDSADVRLGRPSDYHAADTSEALLGTEQSTEAFTYRTAVLPLSGGRGLQMPLPVEVRRTRTYVSVLEPVTGIHGVGATTAEAMADFREALQDFREVLDSAPQLAPALRRLQAQLVLLTGE
ncbi:hypothetical protein ACK8HX_02010 [Oryzobacter sp. R7]|uniref:hypothetical protein n=1 Tax=Oryzobacter faecalis TaxID=3388656 RepID=UPI00398C9E23